MRPSTSKRRRRRGANKSPKVPTEYFQSDIQFFFLFFISQVRFCGSKSICVVVSAMAVKYTLGNEVNETYKMKFASSWIVNSVHPERKKFKKKHTHKKNTQLVFLSLSFFFFSPPPLAAVCEGEIMTVFRRCLIILSKFECQICFAGVAHGIIELHNVDKVLLPYYT